MRKEVVYIINSIKSSISNFLTQLKGKEFADAKKELINYLKKIG